MHKLCKLKSLKIIKIFNMKTTFFLFLNNEGIPKRAKPAIVGRRPTGHQRCPQSAHFFFVKKLFLAQLWPNFLPIFGHRSIIKYTPFERASKVLLESSLSLSVRTLVRLLKFDHLRSFYPNLTKFSANIWSWKYINIYTIGKSVKSSLRIRSYF